MIIKDEYDELEKDLNEAREILGLHAVIRDLRERMEHIANVYGRWQDYISMGFPTTEHQLHALQDFGRAIEKAMDGYNSRERREI
jgi:hypothetical protein